MLDFRLAYPETLRRIAAVYDVDVKSQPDVIMSIRFSRGKPRSNRIVTASIKNPFTMSNSRAEAQTLLRGISYSSSLENMANLKRTIARFGGAYRDRTDDLLTASQALSQLS